MVTEDVSDARRGVCSVAVMVAEVVELPDPSSAPGPRRSSVRPTVILELKKR